MTEPTPIIDVDPSGRDAAGCDYLYEASPEAVADGLLTTRAVTLRYPDGRLEPATEVLITMKGLAVMATDMAADQP